MSKEKLSEMLPEIREWLDKKDRREIANDLKYSYSYVLDVLNGKKPLNIAIYSAALTRAEKNKILLKKAEKFTK